MARHDVGALLVTRDDELVGIFSERDYARKVILLGKSSKELSVKEIMTEKVLYALPEHTVASGDGADDREALSPPARARCEQESSSAWYRSATWSSRHHFRAKPS
jgi:hypothetical protein